MTTKNHHNVTSMYILESMFWLKFDFELLFLRYWMNGRGNPSSYSVMFSLYEFWKQTNAFFVLVMCNNNIYMIDIIL